MPKVLLVDDDVFNREGIRLYLSGQGWQVADAGDEAAGWALAQTGGFDAAVLDISIPPDSKTAPHPSHSFGVSLARRLKTAWPACGVVLFSAYEDRGSDILEMVREGTRGLAYKLKGSSPGALLAALNDVVAGRVVIDPEVHANRRGFADELLKRLTADERPWVEQAVANYNQLTPREKEIALRLAASHNTEGIAQALSLAQKTTENYITHIYDKLALNEMAHDAPHLRKVVVLAKALMINDLK